MPDARPATRPPSAERVLAEFRPDPLAYWRGHGVLALLAAVAGVAAAELTDLTMPLNWVLPAAAVLAVAGRALLAQSAAMAARWRLTERRLAGPGGVALPLTELVEVGTSLGAVTLRTAAGERHAIRNLRDPAAAVAAIVAAQAEARNRTRGQATVPPPATAPAREDAR